MSTLLKKTRRLLSQQKTPLTELAENSKLPYDWLVSIRYNRIKNPSVDRVQKLYEYLTGKHLSV